MTTAGKMPSKYVIHLAAPEMSSDWKTVILKGLDEAEKRKIASISFPLLGTGNTLRKTLWLKLPFFLCKLAGTRLEKFFAVLK